MTDPHRRTAAPSGPRTTRVAARRRLAAAALGTALALSLGAPAALADPVPSAPVTVPEAGWHAESGIGPAFFGQPDPDDASVLNFIVMYGAAPADLSVTVTPVDDANRPTGEAMTVTALTDQVVAGGTVDVLETRRELGDAGAGRVQYTLHAQGTVLATVTLAEDPDTADDVPAEILHYGNIHEADIAIHPEEWTTHVLMPEPMRAFESNMTVYPARKIESYEISAPAAHGGVAVVRTRLGLRVYYRADAGATGEDGFAVTTVVDGVEHTQTFRITLDAAADRVDALDVFDTGMVGAAPLDESAPEWQEVEDHLITGADLPDGPADPVAPVDPEEPGDRPGEGPDTSDDPAEGHEVPDKVETGGQAQGWLAALGLTGTAGLLLARSRRIRLG